VKELTSYYGGGFGAHYSVQTWKFNCSEEGGRSAGKNDGKKLVDKSMAMIAEVFGLILHCKIMQVF